MQINKKILEGTEPTELETAQEKLKQLDLALEELILNVLPELLP